MKRIHVVAAVIERDGHILIARRHDHVHQGGKWEFPGGKVEPQEPVQTALCRELEEELGIQAKCFEPLITVAHDYVDKQVLLDVWRVTEFDGQAIGAEGQEIRWTSPHSLSEFEIPDANVPIVSAAQLPRHYVITPSLDDSVAAFCGGFRRALEAGYRLFQLRIKEALSAQDTAQLVSAISAMKQEHDAWVLVNSDMSDAVQSQLDGVHLTSGQLHRITSRPSQHRWVAASCHSLSDIQQAEKLGLDFVTLSPFKPTASHPHAQPLPLTLFSQWVSAAKLPVYGLGGVAPADLGQLVALGAQGGAGISGYWPGSKGSEAQ